jgi:hopene-associated glycosyltransferase HpnB
MLLALAIVTVLIWLGLLVGWYGFWRADQRLPLSPEPLAKWPSVVAVMPARDEAATIPFSLTGLIEQRYGGAYEIVLADDSSSDDTVAMAGRLASDAEPKLTVVEAGPLPAGWAGKLWTLHRGIEEACRRKPDYYWLTDADIAHKPQVLTALVAHAETERLALASLMVRLPTRTLWEKLLVPAFIFYFALLYPFRAVNDPSSRIAGAAGGSLLVRRDALEAIGGIAAIKHAIIDDCALARAIKGSGRRIWLGLAERSRSLRRYRHLADFWAMVARSAYPQLGYSPLRLVLALLGLGIAFLAPPLLLLAGGAAALVGLVAWGLMGWAYAPTVKYHGLSPVWAVSLPIAALLFAAMTIASAVAHYRGQPVQWRGRPIGVADSNRL